MRLPVFYGKPDWIIGRTDRYCCDQAMPLPDAEVLINTTVLLYTDSEENGQQLGEDDLIEVPDVTNKSIREANNILVSKGLKLRIEGTGLAVSQQPAPGTRVEPGTTVTVSFEPPQ